MQLFDVARACGAASLLAMIGATASACSHASAPANDPSSATLTSAEPSIPDEPDADVDAPAPHPELNRLAQLVEKLADKVAPAAPELARKLDALAKT